MELSARQPDGATLRDHLQRMAANTGRVDDRLLIGELPREAAAVWDTYASLSAARRSSMGPHALTLTDIEAWCRLFHVELTPWELDTVLRLDAASLQAAARLKPKEQ
jgi:hypothetical protein